MARNNPYQVYKQNAVNTASQGELSVMLYNGCLKFIKLAKKDIHDGDMVAKNTHLIRAQDIIREFMVTLNMDSQISNDLMRLYDYLYRQLIEANIHNDLAVLDEVEGFIVELRDTWKEAIQLNRQKQFAESGQA